MEINNRKYKIFMLIILLFSLDLIYMIFSVLPINTYSKFDITGICQLLHQILLIIFLILIISTTIYAFKISSNGVNYKFNKIISFIFLGFSIFSLICFIGIRTSEKNYAMKTLEKTQISTQELNLKQLQKYIDTSNNDIFYDRKIEISKQDSSNYFSDFILNYSIFYIIPGQKYRASDDVNYYGPFIQMSLFSLITSVFYLINSTDSYMTTKKVYDNLVNDKKTLN